MIDPVIKTISVNCPRETAFRIFTEQMTAWWPLDKNSVSAMDGKAARSVSMETKVGGALTEIGHDGTKHNWGSVKTFSPPEKLSLLWHIGVPQSKATLVDVSFEPEGAGTRVTLQHSNWQALGQDAQKTRDGYNSGWVGVFEQAFATACRKQAA